MYPLHLSGNGGTPFYYATQTDMSAELFAKVYENGRNENLLDESPHIARQREDLSMQLQALQAASSIINEVRDISLFSYYKVAQ